MVSSRSGYTKGIIMGSVSVLRRLSEAVLNLSDSFCFAFENPKVYYTNPKFYSLEKPLKA